MAYEDLSSYIHLCVSGTGVGLYRSGGVVHAGCGGNGIALASGWNTLATIDAPYRPVIQAAGFGLYPATTVRDVRVTTDGRLQIWADANTNKELRCEINYLIDVSAL